MNYDVFVSYSMNWSSSAYELSAQLDRVNLRCYLDCVESGWVGLALYFLIVFLLVKACA